jgi:hypothetical protein
MVVVVMGRLSNSVVGLRKDSSSHQIGSAAHYGGILAKSNQVA